ncbi:hypothetical protein ACIGFK_05865 [Streptomyces sp. NPDC085524]|uniref:hypothetical protein n=1 Tax=Streptomyces sp. NPDC085524 TaxID=3365728 RepID=UPI0037D22467
MAEQWMDGYAHCEPCEECVQEAWQVIDGGVLRWEAYDFCPSDGSLACDRGRGVPPPWIRERIVALEGTVRLPVGGPDGVPIALLRRVYGLTIAEVAAARATGWEATPVEARFLAESAGAADPGQAYSSPSGG